MAEGGGGAGEQVGPPHLAQTDGGGGNCDDCCSWQRWLWSSCGGSIFVDCECD